MGRPKGSRNKKPRTYRVNGGGYLVIHNPSHPVATKKGLLLVHRQVAYDAGLLTDLKMNVHHKNENKQDNRLENLEVISPSEHSRLHNYLASWTLAHPEKKRTGEKHPMFGKHHSENTKNLLSEIKLLRAEAKGRTGFVNKHGNRIIKIGGQSHAEHTWVAERLLGRPLQENEWITHLDGNRLNCDPANLELNFTVRPEGYIQQIMALRQFGVRWKEVARILGGTDRAARSALDRHKVGEEESKRIVDKLTSCPF